MEWGDSKGVAGGQGTLSENPFREPFREPFLGQTFFRCLGKAKETEKKMDEHACLAFVCVRISGNSGNREAVGMSQSAFEW